MDNTYRASGIITWQDLNNLKDIAGKANLLPSERITININVNLICSIVKSGLSLNSNECTMLLNAISTINNILQIAEDRNLKFPAQPLEFH